MKLEGIRGKDGSATRLATRQQQISGCTIGTAVNSTCYICRKYLCPEGKVVYKQTCLCCSICKMPLCKESRKDESINQAESCFEEYEYMEDQHLLCSDYVIGQPFPQH